MTSPHIIVCKSIQSLQEGAQPSYVLHFNNHTYSIILGRSGVSAQRTEGDGTTPAGTFPLRRVFYNPERMSAPVSGLPVVSISRDDGWCDDAVSPQYNQLVKLPFPYSHEVLWREDSLYDVLIEVGYNDDPALPGKGSAIFIHVMPEVGFTEGCISLKKEDLLDIITHLTPQSTIEIQE
jgi:L,D-peptidoglycan transpeptidase YkuD (ErfK/YbiS/YcfS/YnhG family)